MIELFRWRGKGRTRTRRGMVSARNLRPKRQRDGKTCAIKGNALVSARDAWLDLDTGFGHAIAALETLIDAEIPESS